MALTGQDTVGGLDHKLVRLGVDLQHLVGVSFCHGHSPPDIDCRPYCAGLRGMRQEAKKYRRAYWRGTTPAYEKPGSLVQMLAIRRPGRSNRGAADPGALCYGVRARRRITTRGNSITNATLRRGDWIRTA